MPGRLLDDLMPGTVALPYDRGHQHATGLGVASKTSGVNVNLLAAAGPAQLERVSGMAHLTGIPVAIQPAAGPQATGSWSGIDADAAAVVAAAHEALAVSRAGTSAAPLFGAVVTRPLEKRGSPGRSH